MRLLAATNDCQPDNDDIQQRQVAGIGDEQCADEHGAAQIGGNHDGPPRVTIHPGAGEGADNKPGQHGGDRDGDRLQGRSRALVDGYHDADFEEHVAHGGHKKAQPEPAEVPVE